MAPVTQPIPLPGNRYTVPGNRWDLAPPISSRTLSVAVVIPFYNQHRQLDLVLRALALQDYPPELLSVIVADDGSATAPTVPSGVRVVRQPDLGFRAAAARNLGANATDADVLCFLDADTIPEPGYVRRIVALPSVLPDALVVGRRRHADLNAMTPDGLSRWWAGELRPLELAEPSWLRDEYARSADLLRVDHRSYRYVISAVMCCTSVLFHDVGGFDESFTHYGGEDWEFAHRAMAGGAVLHHARDAVAWHDGPDWGERPVAERITRKNREAMALARRITDPDARTHGVWYAIPDIVVRVAAESHTAASLLRTLGCFLHGDVGVWVDDHDLLAALELDDPRVRSGAVPEDVLRRCRFVIDVDGRAVMRPASVHAIVGLCSAAGVGEVDVRGDGTGVRCRASWAISRARRWTLDAAEISETVRLDAAVVELSCGEANPDLSW